METMEQMAGTAIGIFAAMSVWFVLMGFVRRRSGCAPGRDVLEFMTHGCAGCKGDGACDNRRAEEERP